jgi:hypothetical protein
VPAAGGDCSGERAGAGAGGAAAGAGGAADGDDPFVWNHRKLSSSMGCAITGAEWLIWKSA